MKQQKMDKSNREKEDTDLNLTFDPSLHDKPR